MSSVPTKIKCVSCKHVLEEPSWHDAGSGTCRHCLAAFEFIALPALRDSENASSSLPLAQDNEASCFFHRENKAEVVCEACGRYLCPVCAVDFGGRKLCPACIEKEQLGGGETVVGSRVLWDSIALSLAVFPLPLFVFTCVTAPAALGVAVVGWRKPCSLVSGKRIRLVIAMVIASLQILGWVLFILYQMTVKRKH